MKCLTSRTLALLLAAASLVGAAEEMESVQIKPCLLVMSDHGDSPADRRRYAGSIARHISATSDFFFRAFDVKASDFVDYAKKRHSEEHPWDQVIPIRVWRRREEFIADFQRRYDTKTIPGAFFGIIRKVDEYGKPGAWHREIGATAEGATEVQVLRHLYHEMGHLFMRTYMFWPVEVPSWIEEGVAELFQWREGNGTHPEADRIERLAWMHEMIALGTDEKVGVAIPWKEFTQVRNMDNLNFTFQDPLRSTVQYAQAWSVGEFMVADRRRGRAFSQLLKAIKEAAQAANREAQARHLQGEKFFAFINDRIYEEQYALFKQCYGRDVFSVEDLWRTWVADTVAKEQRAHPELWFHRGAWHVEYRASRARDEAERERILARGQALFEEGIKVAPKAPESYIGLARLAMLRGDNALAGTYFATANELGADAFEVRLYAGIASLRSGRPDDAIAVLRQAVEERPTHFEAALKLGQALGVKGGDAYDEAKLLLERAIDLKPSARGEISLVLGTAAAVAGQLGDAKLALFHARNDLPGHPLIPCLETLVYRQAGEDAEGERLLAAAVERGDDLAKAMNEGLQGGATFAIAFGEDGEPGIVGLTLPRRPE